MLLSKNGSGFTLVEVLIAILILSVALMGAAGLTIGIITGNMHSNRVTTATTLAQEKMEDIRRLGYSGVSGSDATVTEGYHSISSYPFYKRVTATDVDNPDTHMKTITVTVYWNSDKTSVELKIILANVLSANR